MQVLSNKQQGFTIVELIVVITVLGILIGIVLGTLGDFYTSNTTSLGQTTQDTDTRGVLRSIENDLTNSASFEANIVTVTPLGSDNNPVGWSYKGNDSTKPNNRVLIASAYATDKSPTDDTRMVVFQNTGAGCSPALASPAKNNLIYFVDRDPATTEYNLYRRTMVNPTLCSTPYQKQTCTAGVASSLCKGTDAVLLHDITSFTVDYYTSSNDASPIPDQYSTNVDKSALIAAAKSIKITVVTNQLINGKNSQNTANIRISRSY